MKAPDFPRLQETFSKFKIPNPNWERLFRWNGTNEQHELNL